MKKLLHFINFLDKNIVFKAFVVYYFAMDNIDSDIIVFQVSTHKSD